MMDGTLWCNIKTEVLMLQRGLVPVNLKTVGIYFATFNSLWANTEMVSRTWNWFQTSLILETWGLKTFRNYFLSAKNEQKSVRKIPGLDPPGHLKPPRQFCIYSQTSEFGSNRYFESLYSSRAHYFAVFWFWRYGGLNSVSVIFFYMTGFFSIFLLALSLIFNATMIYIFVSFAFLIWCTDSKIKDMIFKIKNRKSVTWTWKIK